MKTASRKFPLFKGPAILSGKVRSLVFAKTILIVSSLCVSLLCSYSTQPKQLVKAQLPPELPTQLPSESTAHESYKHGFPLALTLRFGNGAEALFLVDTGCSKTTLDTSFESLLGPCLGRERVLTLERGIKRARVFAAPKLYLGNMQLMTGDTILIDEVASPYDCPYKGILGMDCMWHYCIQMDFPEGKVRFLNPHDPQRENLGTRFPIFPTSALSPVPLIDMNLANLGSFRFRVDSGFWNVADATLTPTLMRKASQNNLVTATSSYVGFRVYWCESMVIGGENYTNLVFGDVPIQGDPDQTQGFIGQRFLARHLVTCDFPNRVLYLKPKSPNRQLSTDAIEPAPEKRAPNAVDGSRSETVSGVPGSIPR